MVDAEDRDKADINSPRYPGDEPTPTGAELMYTIDVAQKRALGMSWAGRGVPVPESGGWIGWPDTLLGPVKAEDAGKPTLVLDLDETLVHSSFKPIGNPDYVIPVKLEGHSLDVFVLKRPYVDEFLDFIAGELGGGKAAPVADNVTVAAVDKEQQLRIGGLKDTRCCCKCIV